MFLHGTERILSCPVTSCHFSRAPEVPIISGAFELSSFGGGGLQGWVRFQCNNNINGHCIRQEFSPDLSQNLPSLQSANDDRASKSCNVRRKPECSRIDNSQAQTVHLLPECVDQGNESRIVLRSQDISRTDRTCQPGSYCPALCCFLSLFRSVIQA